MRILQINAVYKTKSTGRIAMEMHKYFQSKGIESFVAYAVQNTDQSGDPNIFQVGNIIDHKLHAVAYRIDNMQGCHSTLATKRFLKKIEKLKPDVVLTHNLHSNFLNVPLLLRGLKKLNIKTFLDLDDCWFLTGGCYHYTMSGCDKWLTGCEDCNLLGKAARKKFKINCEVFEETKPHIIATSKWIEREAKKSLLGSRCDIHMIYNWIDIATFYRRETSMIRAKYQIQTDTVILGVSTFWSKDKGQEEMLKISQKMPEATVILVGRQPEDAKYPENVITIPFTDSKDELAELYSVADIFFNPTRQETFGLVSGEALACGTPLVVYNTTACPEFVTEETGVIMEQNTDIVTAVKEMLDKNQRLGREFVAEKCRMFVEKNFNMDTNIGQYIELFHKALEVF